MMLADFSVTLCAAHKSWLISSSSRSNGLYCLAELLLFNSSSSETSLIASFF